jgi:hypothetical protein
VKPDAATEEITVVEAAEEFQATAEEKAVELPETHHAQVRAAVERFAQDAVDNEPAAAVPAAKLGPRDSKAMGLLKACAKFPGTSADDRDRILMAEAAIQAGTYQALPRRIGQLANRATKEKLSPTQVLDGVMDILRDFHLGHVGRGLEIPGVAEGRLPEIILSESFSA